MPMGSLLPRRFANWSRVRPSPRAPANAAVTASFGVASTGPHGPDLSLKVETLIRAADECLYKSKLAGRNCSSGQEIAVSLALMAHG